MYIFHFWLSSWSKWVKTIRKKKKKKTNDMIVANSKLLYFFFFIAITKKKYLVYVLLFTESSFKGLVKAYFHVVF